MSARKKIFHDENTRLKIQTSQIINRLEKHIDAKPEYDQEAKAFVTKELMTPSQVTAALGLLKKTLPDLSAVEHSGEINTNDTSSLSDAELANIAAAGSTRAVEPATGKKVTH